MQNFKIFFKNFFKVPMLVVFFVICFVFLPSAINLRSIAFRTAIVVALGIDIDDNDRYLLDAVIAIPSITDDLNENNKIISSSGESVIDALCNMNLIFGKAIRLGHVRFVVIGNKLSNKNVANAIDGIIRTNKIRDSVQLIMCESDVHELFNVGIELKNKTGLRLSDIVCHMENYSTTSFNSNVDGFYKGYFSKSKISKLNCLTITDQYNKGISFSNQEEGAGGQDNNEYKQNSKNKYISNIGKIAIYKDGVLKDVLTSELGLYSNWTNGANLPKKLIANVTSTEHISKICCEVLGKSVTQEAFFLNGVPMYCCKINLTIDINEIINNDSQVVSKNFNIISEEIKSDIGREIRSQIGEILKYSKQTKLDVLGLNDYFFLNVYDEYNNYIKTKTTDNFLDDVQLNADINIKII